MTVDRHRTTWRALSFIVAGIAITSAGHYLTPPEYRLWHGIFQRLYYLPVVYAAIAFGMDRGTGRRLGVRPALHPPYPDNLVSRRALCD